MSFFNDLLEKPAELSTASKYSVMNGFVYLALGALFIVWPGSVQTIFMDAPFVGNESALFRVIGMTVAVIGWLYLFGGRSGARQFGPASVLDRVVLVPAVLVPLVIAGVFPHMWGRLRFLTPHSASVLGCSTIARRDRSPGSEIAALAVPPNRGQPFDSSKLRAGEVMQNNNQSLGETTLALYSLGIACLALSAVKALACAVASTTTTQAQIPTSVGTM